MTQVLSLSERSKRFFLDVARWVPVMLAVQEYVGTVRQTEGRSMQPTMNSTRAWWRIGDLLLLDRWHARSYERGDVVELLSPCEVGAVLIKRVIGVEGDLVRPRCGDGSLVRVPRGHVWVEGDNGPLSHDSNAFGCVPAGLVQSRVAAKILPLSEAGAIECRPPPRDRVIPSRYPRGMRYGD